MPIKIKIIDYIEKGMLSIWIVAILIGICNITILFLLFYLAIEIII